MLDLAVLLPDFALIVCGHLICRYTVLDRPVWDGAERLVYYLLFPALLFNAIVRNPLNPGTAMSFGGAGVAVVGTGIVLGYALRLLPRVDAHLHASGAQTAFRFNSYVGWRWPSGWPARRGWRGRRCWCRCACRCATSPRSGRWHAPAATATGASSCATR